ncbi:HDOD domain-containing protein [Methylotenera sp. L2L1]|uniref:HDOD domain-containing protein n=1 Tax=Methylotenera sp. L2L1 TaxID=1502770 RepID=UPI00055F6FF8|nr:HDOD domain-containing protein [Methylotenera sp. L2L1]
MVNKIDRFEMLRKLNESEQNAVYLALDPHMGREVMIKLLPHHGQHLDALLKQVRIVSKLQHNNIVTLLDAGEHDGVSYLVYAFVNGITLSQQLKSSQPIAATQAVQMIVDVLEGVSYAHTQGVLPLGLHPDNLMMTENQLPMMMGIGMTNLAANHHVQSVTPYTAPELISGDKATVSADIFALGVMLHEIVTGLPFIEKTKKSTTLPKASVTPQSIQIHLDEALESIILKATSKAPEDRYADANAMKQALQDYLSPVQGEHKPVDAHSTMDFLLRRMRSKSDFPALSHTISEINRLADDDSASNNALAQSILNDFALTNKLLKLVNTVTYGQFGGHINTISKAVVILGFETVRNVAMSLILLDFLQNKAQASQLKDDVLASFFAGILAAQLAPSSHVKNAEEAIICSMFRNLGKLLASFYFFEESQQVSRLVTQGDSEDKASVKVLGMTYNELGIGVAKSWNFPPRLIAGMRKLTGDRVIKPNGELESLSLTVNLANELCTIASNGNVADKSKALKQLATRYESALSVSEQQLRKSMESALDELAARARIVGINTSQSMLMTRVNAWIGARTEVPHKSAEETELASLGISLEQPDGKNSETAKLDSESILTEGIQEVTNTLIEEHQLNDIMQMVLETMHRGMGFNRTLLFIRDVKNNQMAARFGFGYDIDAALKKFKFSLDFAPDVFHLAISKGADLMLEDIAADNVTAKIPQWYRQTASSQSFLLLPIMVNNKALGMFYADMEQPNSMQVSARQLSLLRTLRNQSVLAIKQKG